LIAANGRGYNANVRTCKCETSEDLKTGTNCNTNHNNRPTRQVPDPNQSGNVFNLRCILTHFTRSNICISVPHFTIGRSPVVLNTAKDHKGPQRTPETSQKDRKGAPKHRDVCCWPGSSAFTIEMLHIRNSTIFCSATNFCQSSWRPSRGDWR